MSEQVENERCLSLLTSAAYYLPRPAMELVAPMDASLAVREAATEPGSPAMELAAPAKLGSPAIELAAPVGVPLAVRDAATEPGSPAMDLAAPRMDVLAIRIMWATGQKQRS